MAKRFQFTKAKIDSLPPAEPGSRALYWDEEVKRLALRVTASGVKSFYGVRWAKGKAEWFKLGLFPDMTIEKARRAAERFSADVGDGKSPAAERRTGKKDPLFGDLFVWWLDLRTNGPKPKRASSLREDRRIYDHYLGTLGKKRASAVSKRDIRDLHAKIGTENGPYQANRALAVIRAVYNKAIAHEKITCSNPAAGIEAFEEVERERRLLPGEVGPFLEAVASEPDGDVADFLLIALFTGVRKSTILAMRWEDLNLDARWWKIGRTKNGRPQIVPLETEEIEILQRRQAAAPRDNPWVFPAKSASGHRADIRDGWDRVRADSGLTDLRIHDLRRSLGSWMADYGASEGVIGKMLNHLSPRATKIYMRLTLEPVRQAKSTAVKALLSDAHGASLAEVE